MPFSAFDSVLEAQHASAARKGRSQVPAELDHVFRTRQDMRATFGRKTHDSIFGVVCGAGAASPASSCGAGHPSYAEEHRMRIDSSSRDAGGTRIADSATKRTDEIVPDSDDQDFEWPAPEGELAIEVLDLSATARRPLDAISAESAGSPRPTVTNAMVAAAGLVANTTGLRARDPGAGAGAVRAGTDEKAAIASRQLDRSRFSAVRSAGSRRMRGAVELMRSAPRALAIALVVLAILAVGEGVVLTRVILRRPNPVVPAGAESVRALPPSTASTPRPSQPENRVATIGTGAAEAPRPAARPSTPAASARLLIGSEPSGAQVSIDGRAYGTTPLTLADVTPGQRLIVLRRGNVQVRQTVMVDAGRTVSILAPMQESATTAAGGWLSISSPVDVDVIEGGNLVGTSRSPQIMLGEGKHTISLVNEAVGYRDQEQVRITAGSVTHLAVKLPQTMMAINALPWAEVSIDGKNVGVTPLGNVPVTIGPHEVVFRHPDLGEKKVTTIVKAGAPARLSADLRRQ
jgi:PEGA domain